MRDSGRLRKLLKSLGAVAFSLSCAGCMIPLYHQPQGFSSTYYRHLQQSVPVIPSTPETSLSPLLSQTAPATKPLTPVPATKESDDSQAAEKPGSWWSWIRRPLTFGSQPSAADVDDEAEAEELPADSRASR